VAVRPDETKLLEVINSTIARLKNANEFQAMHEKWFGQVLIEAGAEQAKIAETDRLKNSPKSLSVVFIKEPGNTVKLDRLDGFTATLSGGGASYPSSPITTDDAGVRGSCKFTTPVPPGPYTFSLSRLSVSQAVTIAKEPKTNLTLTMTFTKAGGLLLDVK
jgi:hypothetical protein